MLTNASMSYELKRKESFADGIRRVLLEQVELAAETLAEPRTHGGLDVAIHEARKSFKKVRSGLRLARALLRGKDFRRENRRFREMGRLLSGPRESGVAIATIDGLAGHFQPLLRPEPFSAIRAHFVERYLVALWRTVEDADAVSEVRRGLRKARRKLLQITLLEKSDLAWTTGLRSVYAAGQKWMSRSYATRAPEAFHEWRKQAKHLRYHLRILQPAWCGRLDRASALLHELTDRLGDHHDLTDLRRQIEHNAALRTTAKRRDEERMLRALIDGRRIALEEEMRETGLRVYSRKPDELVERLETHWTAWRTRL